MTDNCVFLARLGAMCYDHIVYLHHMVLVLLMEEWHRMDDEAPWRRNRPGPNPIKVCGHPFLGVPGADDPYRIKPDLVHTFHIGFGADMCASMIVLLCEKQQFGNHRSFDDRLLAAYSHFQSYCHSTHRYTACEEWSKRNMGMTKFLDCYFINLCWHFSGTIYECEIRNPSILYLDWDYLGLPQLM